IANTNDRIILHSGKYLEHDIVIDKKIELISFEKSIIDGENKYQILTIKSDSVKISGITFINTGISFIDDNSAVKLDSVRGCEISNNTFDNNFFAIYLAKTSDSFVRGNVIKAYTKKESYSGNGIHLWYCKNITVDKNYINGHRDGIYFEFVRESHIQNNISINNLRYGLHFMFSDNCSYSYNEFLENGAGVAVMYTKKVKMFKNKFERNWGPASYGILLKDISDSDIENNIFYKNSSGIYVEGSNRINISNNNFTENGWAIRLMANSMDNHFERNNFVGNSFDVTTNSTKNFNYFINNFWSDYKGYDIDKNGIGDIPYRPVKLFSLIVEKNRPTMILLRSLFTEILDVAEKIFPVLTPETLIDESPSMKRIL
ncbi:MAG: nitrous oxide reductase family maturation protein NosD, partial [Ignavibacteriae bacterium]|nr:nitrous oxide reductase family maturation protein NosD [Ignavibacteriota bacterium]